MSRHEIIEFVKRTTEMTVQTGPFAGLKLADVQTWGHEEIGSQLLGIYERELRPVLLELASRRPTLVINVGCAEGYYAVGLARLIPTARVHAFDIDERAQNVCRTNAALNGASDRIVVEGICSPQRLREISAGHTNILVVVDCEGAEKELLGKR